MDLATPDPEEGAVARLTAGIEQPSRDILTRCLSGRLSPAVALMQLLIETEDAAQVRATVDEITSRAALLSRATDSLLRDRVDDLTQLVVENEPGCEKIAEMLRADVDSPRPAPSVEEGIAFCERLFDWSVQQSEEASVALAQARAAADTRRARSARQSLQRCRSIADLPIRHACTDFDDLRARR